MLTSTYILSQIFVIINYLFLIITYQLKDNKKILILNTIACISSTIAFFLLDAYIGCSMTLIAVIRNIIFNKDKSINSLLIIFILMLLFSIYTYENLFSLVPVCGTLLYTISIWQNNNKVYKILGIPVEICWLFYQIYILSIFGIILELVLFVSVIVGIIKEK